MYRYDDFGRLKKKFRAGADDRKAREAAALARLHGLVSIGCRHMSTLCAADADLGPAVGMAQPAECCPFCSLKASGGRSVGLPTFNLMPGQVGVGGESGQGSKDEDGAKAEHEPRSKVGTLPKHLWQQAVMGVYLVQMLATAHLWHALPIEGSKQALSCELCTDVLQPSANLLPSRPLSDSPMCDCRMMTGTEIAAGTETGTGIGIVTGTGTGTGTEMETAAATAIATGSAAAAAKGTWIAAAAAGTGTGIGIDGAAAGTGTGIGGGAAETGTAGASFCGVLFQTLPRDVQMIHSQ